MKKYILLIIVIAMILFLFSFQKEILIPEDAIRFRVIANSDSLEDQALKRQVRDKLELEITQKLAHVNNVDAAKEIIADSIPEFSNLIDSVLLENQEEDTYQIDFGENYFPEKKYKGVTYKAGNYESLVITLGNGIGKNWWCVLFPPLCLLDAEEEMDTNEIEYRFFIKDLIDKYF